MASSNTPITAEEARELALQTGYTGENLEAAFAGIRAAVTAASEAERYYCVVELPHPDEPYKGDTIEQLQTGYNYLVTEADTPPGPRIRISWPIT